MTAAHESPRPRQATRRGLVICYRDSLQPARCPNRKVRRRLAGCHSRPAPVRRSSTLVNTFSLLNVGSLSICFPLAMPDKQPAPTQANKSQPGTHLIRGAPGPRLCAACVRAHMEFLASDALRGRGSGTADELVAATYVAVATARLRNRSCRRRRWLSTAGDPDSSQN